jgi:membrane fusion protein, heavy metal efflux system
MQLKRLTKALFQSLIYNQNKKMKNIIFITIIVILVACGKKNTNEQKTIGNSTSENIVTLTDAQSQLAKIELGKLSTQSLSSIVKINGKIDVPPQNMVSVSMPLGGYLKSSKLLPGMHISIGEVIATMEDQQYIQLQQEYLTTKSKLDFYETEYLRQKELNQSKASSDKIFQQTKMEFTTHKIALSALAEKLKLININPKTLSENNLSKSVNIYSPINGFVSKVNVNIGKYVNPADILFELVNPDDIHLNLKVFEKDVNQLFIGQKVVAFTNHQQDKKYNCEIILISKDLSSDRTVDVHCHFEKYDKTLLPGMYMNAEIELINNSSLAINEDAIVNFEGKDYVFISQDKNQFQLVEVEKGLANKGFIEIKNSETFSTKQIVTKGAYTILMKMKNKSNE